MVQCLMSVFIPAVGCGISPPVFPWCSVQCECVSPVCHAVSCSSCVRGFWREYWWLVPDLRGADMGLCLALSPAEQNQTEAAMARPRERERESGVCVRNSGRQLHNIRPAVALAPSSCHHKEKIVETTGAGEAWPGLRRIMAPNLS